LKGRGVLSPAADVALYTLKIPSNSTKVFIEPVVFFLIKRTRRVTVTELELGKVESKELGGRVRLSPSRYRPLLVFTAVAVPDAGLTAWFSLELRSVT
jgi:hypothetical protein